MDQPFHSDDQTDYPLVQAAEAALSAAAEGTIPASDRQVRRPDTWLLRRCVQALAAHGSSRATFVAVDLLRERDALSPFRQLPVLARRLDTGGEESSSGASAPLLDQLESYRPLLPRPPSPDQVEWGERLLSIACAAAHGNDDSLAFACLERLDQQPGIWLTLLSRTELRELLAETIAHAGPHPLTNQVIHHAIRLHKDAGAQLLQRIAIQAAANVKSGRRVASSRRLLQRCVETFRYSTLVSLLSRRYAATVFGLAGDVQAALEQVTTIANVQEAHRESGLAYREAAPRVLRQVKRPRANLDIDFQFYALKEAVDQMTVDQLSSGQIGMLAERVVDLATGSDGWTAASAAAVLLHLGQVQDAVSVVETIDPRDPTRSEAVRVLVEGLLAAGETEEADVQVDKGVTWAQSLPEHHPERLTIWGIAEAYLAHEQADKALNVLSRRRPPSWITRLRRLFSPQVDEEHLREEALKMYAALLQGGAAGKQVERHLEQIRRWAPNVMEGKALALFYTERVLQPMLATGHHRRFWAFLKDVERVLGGILSREQPARVEAVALLLTEQLQSLEQETLPGPDADSDDRTGLDPAEDALAAQAEAQQAAHDLLLHLWKGSAARGIWATVYSVGGALPLLIALEGSNAVVALARFAASQGQTWRYSAATDDQEEEATPQTESLLAESTP